MGAPVSSPTSRLAGRNLGVFGNSATGKSWMVGLIAEGLHQEEYQVRLIDPEGDFRGLKVLPRFVSITGDRTSLLPPSAVVSLLEERGVSLVLDLSRYPITLRSHYVAELLRALRPVREQKFRPHWIVLDEGQEFLFEGSEVATLLRPVPLPISWIRLLPYWPRPAGRLVGRSSFLSQRGALYFLGHLVLPPMT